MACAALSFAFSFAMVKHLSAGYSTFEIVFLRQLFGFLILLPWLARASFASLRTTRIRLHTQRAFFSYGGVLLGYWSLSLISMADSVALQFTLPMWTAILAILFLGEKVGIHRWLAIAIGLVGVIAIIRPGFQEVNIGMVFALSAAFLYAGSDTTSRALSRTDSTAAIMFYGYLLVLPLSVIPAAMDWITPTWADTPAWVGFAASATLAQFCLTRSLSLADASLVSPVLFLRLPFASAIAWIFFNETTDLWTWIGAGIIFSGTFFLAHRESAKERRGA